MFLKHLRIENLRALEDIEFNFDAPVAVIVGPNAIGKTTVLQAIRLAKGVLAPRTAAEAQQVLASLGAVSPTAPNKVLHAAIARDANKPVLVESIYKLSDPELVEIETGIPQLATALVQAQLGQSFGSAANLTAFFSSPAGVQALSQATTYLENALSGLKTNKSCELTITIDSTTARISGKDSNAQTFISFLEGRQPPYKTIFSYFPADRALPAIEQAFQLGQNDVGIQLETYDSQPQLKYNRLRNAVFGAVLRKEKIQEEFNQIFNSVLTGRELQSVGLDQNGSLSIIIRDTIADRSFDIDNMSSGEKGLILTFLIISQTLANDGIILIDEPELHLNPAATRKLLTFLTTAYILPRNLQAIICSHSPEILADAFERTDCTLYHLKSPNLVDKVRKSDYTEVNFALQLLGTSAVDALLFDSELFVEGDDDVQLLTAGFGDSLSRYSVKSLGGRAEVEKQIKLLQEEEKKGALSHKLFFIFDRDNQASSLESTSQIRILQWEHYCIENYLLDYDIIADTLREPDMAPAESQRSAGELRNLFKELARKQLTLNVAKSVYGIYNFQSLGFRPTEAKGKDFDEIANLLMSRITVVRGQIGGVEEAWKSAFVAACESKFLEEEPAWSREWERVASGKQLFLDFRQTVQLSRPLAFFKTRLMDNMRQAASPTWRKMSTELQAKLFSDSR